MYGVGFDQIFPGDPFSPHSFVDVGSLLNLPAGSTRGGVPLYYSNGFLSAGAGQTGGGGGLLSAITTGFETVLPAIFGQHPTAAPGGITGVPSVRTPPIVASRSVGTAIKRTASQHPVLTAAGGAGAIAGVVAATKRGRKFLGLDGKVHVHRRMNPCNIHALRRGLRRATAFERIAKRVLHITSPRKHVHGFKLPRRKK